MTRYKSIEDRNFKLHFGEAAESVGRMGGKWLRAREVRILRDSARRAKCKKPSQVTGAALLSGRLREGGGVRSAERPKT